MSKTVVFFTWEFWSGPIHISAHALAKTFVEDGWKVAFVTVPLSPLHSLLSSSLTTNRRKELGRDKGEWFMEDRLWAYVPNEWLPPQNQPSNKVLGFFYKFLRKLLPQSSPNLVELLKENGFDEPTLSILDCAYFLPVLSKIYPQKVIQRITDLTDAFPNMASQYGRWECLGAQQADLVTYSSQGLKEYAQALGARKITFIPHGVDLDLFSKPQGVPIEYKQMNSPIAVYVGTIGEWFDFEAMEVAAKALPEVQFVIIGLGNKCPVDLEKWVVDFPNLHFLGMRPHSQIPAYLQHADVGLIPFRLTGNEAFVNAINPIKVYEYLACHLPIVSSPLPSLTALKQNHQPLFFYEMPADVVTQLGNALMCKKETSCKTGNALGWKVVKNQILDSLYESKS
ncbi:MAG: glycosyltransferase [Terasakiella sp.]|uniref:glycosyltransferase n=1 Tax=unclassified Terasakiella TaxID=2614952 RepID=UPI003B007D1A